MPQSLRERITVAAALTIFLCSLMLISPNPSAAARDAQGDLASLSRVANQEEPRMLEPGKPARREITRDHPHAYWIDLAANQYLRVSAEEADLEVKLVIFDPAGAKVIEANCDYMRG